MERATAAGEGKAVLGAAELVHALLEAAGVSGCVRGDALLRARFRAVVESIRTLELHRDSESPYATLNEAIFTVHHDVSTTSGLKRNRVSYWRVRRGTVQRHVMTINGV